MAKGEGEEEGDGQYADEGGSVWEGDVDCTWAVSDEDENEDEVNVIRDAQYFVPGAESGDESEESEGSAPELPAIMFEIDVASGREEFSTGAESAPMYSSLLASPPERRNSSKTSTFVDPWVSGSDPWRRDISTDFADRFRQVESPVRRQ